MRHASKTDQAFLEQYDPSAFERPSVTVDVALLSPKDGALWTLLAQRQEPPFKDAWGLPGGFIQMNESLDAAAARVLREKAGVKGIFLEQLFTFGETERDPRMRIISVAYYALIPPEKLARAAESTQLARINVPWEGETGGPVVAEDANGKSFPLPFDHDEILGMAVKRVRGKLDYTPIGFELLPQEFTLSDLQHVHEIVSGRHLNKDSFRRRMLASDQLEPTGEAREGTAHRQPALFRRKKN
ncbi:MAG: NUDIX domain-containing protein [Vulcanimicrobiaceae bacterium]|jgi:8-oxo-dGTP diphosphatase